MIDNSFASSTENIGNFRCETTFYPTGRSFCTDLPESLNGLAQHPSPGDLLGAALASCMTSMISYVAAKNNVDVKGMKIEARPEEDGGGISKINLKITMPLATDHPLRAMLERSAKTCPVHKSLRSDLETPIEWLWADKPAEEVKTCACGRPA